MKIKEGGFKLQGGQMQSNGEFDGVEENGQDEKF